MKNIQFKFFNILLTAILICVSFFLATESAEARRMGFGRSIGKPPIKRQAIPPSQSTKKAVDQKPGNSINSNNNKTKSGFMGPLAGLAAGLGLAALASHLGVGEELMGFLLLLLGAGILFFIFKLLLRNMQSKTSLEGVPSGFNKSDFNLHDQVKIPQKTSMLKTTSNSITDDEINNFLEIAKKQFIELQKIWDSGNLKDLKSFCTDNLVSALAEQIKEKKIDGSKTSVTELNAQWMGIESYTNGEDEIDSVSINFSGLIRENEKSPSEEFSEIWTLERSKNSGNGWLVAGITQTEK